MAIESNDYVDNYLFLVMSGLWKYSSNDFMDTVFFTGRISHQSQYSETQILLGVYPTRRNAIISYCLSTVPSNFSKIHNWEYYGQI